MRKSKLKPAWQIETEIYIPRIHKAIDVLSRGTLKSTELPAGPFEAQLSEEQHMLYSLAMFSRSGVIVVDQLLDNIGLLWSEGRMVGIGGLVRFALEYWAAIHFGRKISENYFSDGNIEIATQKTAKLTHSGKTPVKLPWGRFTTNPAYSVATFLQLLEKSHPHTKEDYDFLSEATHPNFLQNFYFIMASRTYDNFSNDTFKKHAHGLLENVVVAIERIAAGLSEDVEASIRSILPRLP